MKKRNPPKKKNTVTNPKKTSAKVAMPKPGKPKPTRITTKRKK